MIFYIVFIIVEFLLLNIRGRYQKISYGIGFLSMVMISVIRFDVGYDYPSYYEIYYSSLESFDRVEILEPLSKQIIYISRWLGSPYWIIIIFGCLTYFFLYLSLRDFKFKEFALYIYICFLWLSSLDIMRQSLAICILLYAYRFVISKKIWKYLIFVILATLFHTTALIGILIYFVFQKFNIKTIIICGAFTIIVSSLVFNWMSNVGLYTYVIENTLGTQSGNKLVIFYTAFYIFIVFLYYNVKTRNQEILKTLLVISISFIFFFAIQAMSAWRIGLYFISLYTYAIPQIINSYSSRTKLSIYLLLTAFFLTSIIISTYSPRSPFIPYDTIFSHLENEHPNFRF